MKKKPETGKKSRNAAHSLLSPVLISLIVGLIVFLLFTAACSLLTLSQDLSFDKMPYMLMCACILSSSASGFVLSRKADMKGIIAGALAALPLIFVETILLLTLSGDFTGGRVYLTLASMIVSGACGGIFAANFKRVR